MKMKGMMMCFIRRKGRERELWNLLLRYSIKNSFDKGRGLNLKKKIKTVFDLQVIMVFYSPSHRGLISTYNLLILIINGHRNSVIRNSMTTIITIILLVLLSRVGIVVVFSQDPLISEELFTFL